MKKLLRKHKKLLFPATALLLLVTLLVIAAVLLLSSPGTGTVTRIIELKKGEPLKKFAVELEKAQVIAHPWLFTTYARITGKADKLQAGTYQFDDSMSLVEVLRRLANGEVLVLRFTVPEGYSIYQIAELLEQQQIYKKEPFLQQCFNRKLLSELEIRGASVEGYLYPSTYKITREMDEAAFIRQMARQFSKVYEQKFGRQVNSRHMRQHELITLASLIEKEAAMPYERPLIASVFINRLKRGMRLQSDPTAIYGQRAFGSKVRKRDVMNSSPYNTYRFNGLPPGPIGNPSSEAIEAVLNPAKTNYLYFVAKKDGTHYFSTSLIEHNNAVRKYLRSSASARRSEEAPPLREQNDRPIITRRR